MVSSGWTIRWTAAFLAVVALSPAAPAHAREWLLLAPWLTADQQGRVAFDRGDYARAASLFTDPMWRGVAHYRAGDYAAAIDDFARLDTAAAYYDEGNALARLGRLPPAVASYEQALKRRPGWTEAQANSKLLRDLIARQKKDQDKEGQEPLAKPDSVQFDEEGKKGNLGRVDLAAQTAEIWMRNIQVSPTDLLARRFAIEAAGAGP